MMERKKGYQVILFDLDGTIVDSALGITASVIYTLKKYGIEETDRKRLYRFIGPPLTESFQKYYNFTEEQSLEAVRFYREYYSAGGMYECQAYEGLEETLARLRDAGKRLVVATSKPEPYARSIIRYLGLDSYFEYIAGMELDGGRGTKAEVIEYAMQVCRISRPEDCLMVGDREHDVVGAKKAGIDCLGVLYGFGGRKELEDAGAKYIAELPGDILQYVGE